MKHPLILIGFVALTFVAGCHRGEEVFKRTIFLDAYEKFELDSSVNYLDLKVLKYYESQMSCISGLEKYGNLYITKMQNGESLYIFQYCGGVPEHIDDTTGRYVHEIHRSTILKGRQDSVIIFVPKDFNLPTGVKYMFATMGTLVES
jgi:hypothetical protein